MASLIVSAIAEWNGKALKQAGKDVSALDKTIYKLGGTLAAALSVRKIYQFSKASVKAFSEDEAAAVKLSKAVDNLGLSLSNTDIANFIQQLEKQSSVLDDVLRPSFQALLTTTGDVRKSQELLTNAIDISRGAGVELSTVSQDLANGFVGITKGLKKYNLGLTQSQLKTKSFEEIMVLLNKQFSGASAAYLSTYAGKMAVLTTASANAKETIGKGLVDALILAGGKDADVQDVANAMDNLATNTANAVRGVGFLIGKLDTLGKGESGKGLFGTIVSEIASAVMTPYRDLANLGKKTTLGPKVSPNRSASPAGTKVKADQMAAAKIKADAKNLAIQKELNKTAAATAKINKQAALTSKQSLLFNQTAISAVAALKNKLSEEERNKVLLMLALEMDNVEAAALLSQKVANAYDETGMLAEFLRTLPDAKNPFAAWDKYIDDLMKKINDLLNPPGGSTYKPAGLDPALAAIGIIPGYGDYSGSVDNQANNTEYPNFGMQSNGDEIMTNLPDEPFISYNPLTGLNYNPNSGNGGITQNFSVTVNNPVGNGVVDMVQQAILDASRLGHNLTPAGSL